MSASDRPPPSRPSLPAFDPARARLLEQLVEEGKLETCPTCGGIGLVTPDLATRARETVPPIPPDRPTEPDLSSAPPRRKT